MGYLRHILLLVLSLLTVSCQRQREKLEDQIAHELSQQTGTFAVAFKDLTTNEQVLIREHEVFHAASTMKTPVMIEVFKQASVGKLAFSDSILIKNDFRSIVDGSPYSLNVKDDSDQALYEKVGTKRLLSELVYDMIIVSSNLATNIIIELVDAKEVTQTMRDLGAKDIVVLRGVEDSKAFEKGLVNTTTAYDLMLMFEKMAKGEVVGTEACQAMIDILLDQRFNTILPARLPGDVRVAHKTGSIAGVHHDSGIVFLPDGRKYVLVLLSKNLEDEVAATNAMANVSELIYRYVINDKP